MPLTIDTIGPQRLAEYASVPIAFEVRAILYVDDAGHGVDATILHEQAVQAPYVKDYDSYADEGPTHWPMRFDVSRWGLFLARDEGEVVGGAAVAWNTPGVHMLEGRNDLAVLWDIRVRPAHRHRGVGAALFAEAVNWSRSHGCRQLKVETQNVNVGACRFYERMGCVLGRVDRLAYRDSPEVAHEIMLVWELDLAV
jgi:GNAT superfamily N-acetyltransferase